MRIPAYLAIIFTLTVAAPLHAASGGGGGGSMPQQTMKRLTPEEKAVVSYNSGIRHRDKAAKYELTQIS